MTTGREIYQLPHRIAILQNHFVTGGATRNRTGVHGFAGRCITTLPSRHDRFGRLPLNRWSLRARHPPDRRILGAGNETGTRALNPCFPITFSAAVSSEGLNYSLVFRPRQQSSSNNFHQRPRTAIHPLTPDAEHIAARAPPLQRRWHAQVFLRQEWHQHRALSVER